MTLNKEQQEIVNATEPFIIVNSCAASGKTTALTQRIAHLIDNGANPDKIVVITFTNQAASMLKERLGARKIGEMYIGTIHGYCARLLSRGKVQISSILEDEKFDELFEKIGENPWCIEEVDYLFVDEAQDCTIEQFDFFDLINPHNRLYVGDFHQAIYGFSGGSVKTFRIHKTQRCKNLQSLSELQECSFDFELRAKCNQSKWSCVFRQVYKRGKRQKWNCCVR